MGTGFLLKMMEILQNCVYTCRTLYMRLVSWTMLLLHYDYVVAAATAASVSQERAGIMAAMPARRG